MMVRVDSDRSAKDGTLAKLELGADPGPEADEIVEIVERHQARHRALCWELETIADSLPMDVNPSLCMRLARRMMPALRASQEFKEQYFCPLARKVLRDQSNLDAILERLRAEYRENELLAEEVAEELSQWGACAEPRNPETVGYMLRGVFISLMRHLDFERVVLIEPIKSRLSHPEGAGCPAP